MTNRYKEFVQRKAAKGIKRRTLWANDQNWTIIQVLCKLLDQYVFGFIRPKADFHYEEPSVQLHIDITDDYTGEK